jgi:hypothetical protein
MLRNLLLFLTISLSLPLIGLAQDGTFSIVNSLGEASPSTQFSVFGSGGFPVSNTQFLGPGFTLTQPTVITEIGGFLNNCVIITAGVPQCPNTLPFTVQIRPSVNGAPDPTTVLASFVLSHDNNPLVVSYESVAINLPLEPGSYFALFSLQGNDVGFLLGGLTYYSGGPVYLPGMINLGVVNLDSSYELTSVRVYPAAVRIQGNVCDSDNDGDGNPDCLDTDDDNDGQSDADEIACGSNPLDAASKCAPPATGPPTNKEQCKNGGWMTFTTPRRFKNQGDCIQFVNTGR